MQKCDGGLYIKLSVQDTDILRWAMATAQRNIDIPETAAYPEHNHTSYDSGILGRCEFLVCAGEEAAALLRSSGGTRLDDDALLLGRHIGRI